MKTVGYARVSTDGQFTEQQEAALGQAGCSQVFRDHGVSGFFTPARERAGYQQLLAAIEPGDTLVVWRLDRLGRSVKDLIETVNDLNERGVHFRSLNESIDTTTASGKAMFHLFAVFAQLYRDQISENTRAAMQAIKDGRRSVAPGKKHIGRPRRSDLDPALIERVTYMRATGASEGAIARKLGMDRKTLKRNVPRIVAALDSPD